MQLPPQLERKARVGDFLERWAAELHVPVGFAREHFREPLPEAVIGRGHVGREDVVQPLELEGQAEDRGTADDRAVARVESVDPRHRGRADAVGQLVAVTPHRGGEQVEQELRIAARALARELEDVGWQLRGLGRGLRERPGLLVAEPGEIERHVLVAPEREPALAVPAGHEH